MATLKTHWKWDDQECSIEDQTIDVHDTNAGVYGGGASCHLRDFLRGELTWLLPDRVRREALATARAIMKVEGPLPDAVLRGDHEALDPAVRLAGERLRAEQRARDAESARLSAPVTTADLPDARCTVCQGVMDQYRQNRREFERVIQSALPHDRHQPALRAIERRVEELRAGMKDPAACASCRLVASAIRATRRQPMPAETRPMLALPVLFRSPTSVSVVSFARCAECGSVWAVEDFHEENDDTDESTRQYLQLANINYVRHALERLLYIGHIADWLAAAIDPVSP